MKAGYTISLLCFLCMGFSPYVYGHTNVTALAAKNMININDDLIVVDVRSNSEYCNSPGHIPGAINLVWSSGTLAGYEVLPLDADILVVCASGGRSHSAANFLDNNSYTSVYDMIGGMSLWIWETILCLDSDSDGFNDDLDNCVADYNPSQNDSDGDGIGDVCDSDCPYLDGAGLVNLGDLGIFSGTWQQAGSGLAGDLDGDDDVDIEDLRIFAVYWLSTCSEE